MVVLIKFTYVWFILVVNFTFYIPAWQLSIVSTWNSNRNQTNNCTKEEFQCQVEQCIEKSSVCDGTSNCADGSDETYHLCNLTSCNEQFFRCDYGACISEKHKCDGLKQCVDGSDESPRICNSTLNHVIKYRSAVKLESQDLCPQHPPSEDKIITYENEEGERSLLYQADGFLPRFTVARMQCKQDYSPLDGAYFRSICHENSWIPKIDDCYKKCDNLNPKNVDLKCYRKGKSIPCDGDALFAGTRVRPTCKKFYTYREFIPTYREIVCNYDGKWDNKLFSCVPECGIPNTMPTIRISNGNDTQLSESPWHVAIYNRNEVLICGGTIIHSYMVISAAHCFHTTSDVKENAENFEVVVSKYSRNYKKKDDDNQKIYKIREIRYPTKGYAGLINYFTADIAILILEEKIIMSSTVFPACIDWTGLNTNEYLPNGTFGKVVGSGLTEHGTYSETLKVANLPILNRELCLKIVPDDFKPFVTYDKFCAGSENGSSVLQGDSGGGLLLSKDGLYFLRGIVSLKQPSITAIAAFTDLADHIDWILATRNAVEKEMLDKGKKIVQVQNVIPTEKVCNKYERTVCISFRDCPASKDLIMNKKAILCGFEKKNTPRLCCPLSQSSTIAKPTTPRTTEIGVQETATSMPNIPENGDSGGGLQFLDVAIENCRNYSTFATGCVNAKIPDKGTSYALPKEYPHMALIGYGNNFKDAEWLCDGSLIGEKFVLSAARCKNKALGEPKWIMLGALNITSIEDDDRPKIYSIVKSHYSSITLKNSSIHENLALYKLNTTVSLSPYVRPACLHTSSTSPIEIGTKAVISGWGWGPTNTKNPSNEHLLKAALTVVENERCKRLYNKNNITKFDEELENGFQSESMICAGDFTESEALCADIDGSPLQIQIRDEFCSWKIFAISSFGPTSCGNAAEHAIANPRVYVNVLYHLSWIKSIVWPE